MVPTPRDLAVESRRRELILDSVLLEAYQLLATAVDGRLHPAQGVWEAARVLAPAVQLLLKAPCGGWPSDERRGAAA